LLVVRVVWGSTGGITLRRSLPSLLLHFIKPDFAIYWKSQLGVIDSAAFASMPLCSSKATSGGHNSKLSPLMWTHKAVQHSDNVY
jgi:hypothetical protein